MLLLLLLLLLELLLVLLRHGRHRRSTALETLRWRSLTGEAGVLRLELASNLRQLHSGRLRLNSREARILLL